MPNMTELLYTYILIIIYIIFLASYTANVAGAYETLSHKTNEVSERIKEQDNSTD